jgi:hypothetical protein
MKHRLIPLASLLCCLLVPPTLASQPDGQVARLISNPLVENEIGGETGGLPPVVCGGFWWAPPILERQLGSDAILVLDMAVIPFPNGMTFRVGNVDHNAQFLTLRFHDGFVSGLPYDRNDWNDVRVEIRPATQDYMLTVNGLAGGPFPLGEDCQQAGRCSSIGTLLIAGDFLEESTAWIDSLSLTLVENAVPERLLDLTFASCGQPPVAIGALLVTPPPRHGRVHGIARGVTVTPRPEGSGAPR